jgi:DNA-binding transcriptional LysR family regulator
MDWPAILLDFRSAFPWLEIELSSSGDANTDLAELAPDAEIRCTVIVLLGRIFIQESFAIGDYRFVCRSQFDEAIHERLPS